MLLLAETSVSIAQDTLDSAPGVWDIVAEDAGYVWYDGISFATAPGAFTASDWGFAAALFGSTALIMTQDAELRRIRLRNQPEAPAVKDVLEVATAYGNVFDVMVVSGVLYGSGVIADCYFDGAGFKPGSVRAVGRMLMESVLYTATVAAVLRIGLGRKRPYYYPVGEEKEWDFEFMNFEMEENTFPSGHAVVTLSWTVALAEYWDTWIARGILYPMAALGVYARVASDGHWSSDILFGTGLGIAGGLWAAHIQKKRENRQGNSESILSHAQLYPATNGLGIVVSF